MELEKIRAKTADHYLKIANLMNGNADLIDRFALELSPLMRELEHKSKDDEYTKKVLQIYLSVQNETVNNVNRLMAIFEEMKELQIAINRQNFTE